MKTILVNPYPYYAKGIEGIIYPPLGLLYLAAVAKKRDLGEIKVLDANILKMENEDIIRKILGYRPDIIGISSNIVTHRSAIELVSLIKKSGMKQFLLAGGPHPSLFPEKYLKYCNIVVNGEGEETFCEILEAYKNKREIEAIEGILYLRNDVVIRNKNRGFLGDLDELPFPDYSALEPAIGYYSRHSRVIKKVMAPILTSRGCPYQCTYCNKNIFGSAFRFRSPENITKEIHWLHKYFNIDQIDILDDNFNLIIERAEQVLDKLAQMRLGIAISCHNGLRADKIQESFAEKLKRNGVFKVGLGIETGDPDLMKGIKKNLDLEKVKSAVSILRKQGITVHGYFILGLPGDTPLSMERTIKFAKEVNPHFCNFATCIPFPGTEAYNRVKREGKFLEDVDNGIASGFFDGKVFFETEATKAQDVAFYFKLAYKEFYFNINKMLDILFTIRNFKELFWLINTSFSLAHNTLFKRKRLKNET